MKKITLLAIKILIIIVVIISFSTITQIVNGVETVITMSQEYIDKVLKEHEQLPTAYKTVPGASATAEEIKLFIESDFLYNGSKAIKNVAKSTISTWLNTISQKTAGRHGTGLEYAGIEATLSSLKTEGHVTESSTQALEQTVEHDETEYKSVIKFMSNDKGSGRDAVTFVDPLADTTAYNSVSISTTGNNKLKTIIGTILGIIQVIGSIVSVAILAVLGIKYMVGSVEEKAEYKKELPTYVIGAVLLFGIVNIMGALYAWATHL